MGTWVSSLRANGVQRLEVEGFRAFGVGIHTPLTYCILQNCTMHVEICKDRCKMKGVRIVPHNLTFRIGASGPQAVNAKLVRQGRLPRLHHIFMVGKQDHLRCLPQLGQGPQAGHGAGLIGGDEQVVGHER